MEGPRAWIIGFLPLRQSKIGVWYSGLFFVCFSERLRITGGVCLWSENALLQVAGRCICVNIGSERDEESTNCPSLILTEIEMQVMRCRCPSVRQSLRCWSVSGWRIST